MAVAWRVVRRWLRRILKVSLALVLLLVVGTAGLIGFLHTDWGRDVAKRQLESQLSAQLNGSVTIGRLEGSVLSGPSLRRVAVFDVDGNEVAGFESLHVNYSLLSVLRKRVHIRRVTLRGIHVDARQRADGTLNLEGLIPKSDKPPEPPKPEGAPSAWRVHVGSVVVADGAVAHTDRTGKAERLDAVGVRVNDVVFAGGELSVHSFSVTVHESTRDLTLALVGDDAKLGRFATGNVEITARHGVGESSAERPPDPDTPATSRGGPNASHVTVKDISVDTHTMTGSAKVSMRVIARTARLIPVVAAKGWRGDVVLAGTATRTTSSMPAVLGLKGTIAGASVTLDLSANPEARVADATVEVANLQLERATEQAPPGGGTVKIEAHATGDSLATLGGTLKVTGHGTFRDVRVNTLRVTGTATSGTAKVAAHVASNHGKVDALGTVMLGAKPLAFRDVRVDGNVRQLAGFAPPEAKVRGSVSVSLRGSGTLERVNLTGTATVRGARAGELRVPVARADISVRGPIASPRAHVAVHARRVRMGVDRIDGVHLTGDTDDLGKQVVATVRVGNRGTPYQVTGRVGVDLRDPARTVIKVRQLAGRVRKLPVNMRPGATVVLAKGGDVALRDVSVRSAAGNITARGRLSRGVDVRSERLSVADVARRLGLPRPHPQGIITLTARVRRVGRLLSGTASGTLRGFMLEAGRPKLAGSFDVTVARRSATLLVEAAGPRLGSVRFDARTRTPLDVLDVRAWKRMRTRALESADVTMTGLDLAGYLAFAGRPPLASGRLSGSVKVLRGGTVAEAALRADGVGAEAAPETLSGTINVAAGGGRLTIDSAVNGRTVGGIAAHAEAHIPFLLLDVPAWQRIDEYAVASVRVKARSIDLARLKGLAPTMPALRGRVTASVEVAEHAKSITVIATSKKLRAARPGAGQVDATVRATIGQTTTMASLDAKLNGVPVMSGSGSLQGGLRTLALNGAEGMRHAPIRGRWKVSNLSLRTIADELRLEQRRRVSGMITATADVSGSADKPLVSGSVDLGGARFDKISFRSFEMRGGVDDRAIRLSAVAEQNAGGRLEARATLSRSAKPRADVKLDVGRFDLGFLSSLDRTGQGPLAGLKGVLDAKVTLSGPLVSARPKGWVKMTGGAMRMEGMVPLRDVGVRVDIDGSALSSSVTARSGGGSLDVTATARLAGRRLASASAEIRSKRFPVMAGQQKLTVDSHTTISARHRGELLLVEAVLESALVRVPSLAKERTLHSTNRLADVVFADQVRTKKRKRRTRDKRGLGTVSTKPTMRLKVRVPDSLRIRSEIAQATVGATLDITMVGGDVIIDGDAKTSRGRVDLLDRRYKISTAEVAFDGSVPPNPTLRVELAHAFDSMTLYVDVTGTANEPKIGFRADPAGPDRATLLAIFLGRDPDDPAGEAGPLENRAVEVASGLLIDQVQSVIRDVLPIDVLKVEVDDVASQRPSAVTVGKWVSDDLFVAYRYSPTTDDVNNTNEAQLEYRLDKRWSLEGTYGDRGKGGVDILWIKRY